MQAAQHRLGAFAAQFQLQPEMAKTAGRLVDLGSRHRMTDRLDQHGHFAHDFGGVAQPLVDQESDGLADEGVRCAP